jgi:hypothetical protein
MHASWHMQLPALADAYLTWKHNGSLNITQISAHKFQVTTMHVFGMLASFFKDHITLHFLELNYLHNVMQQHEEFANVSLLAPYFRMLYVSYPKIRMAIVAYPKVRTTIVWYPGREEGNVFLSEDKE